RTAALPASAQRWTRVQSHFIKSPLTFPKGASLTAAPCCLRLRERCMTEKDSRDATHIVLNRRSILLAGTTLAAATALASPSQIAQAQQPQAPPASAPSGSKPNILVIFGDDIGIANLSTYSQGLMGYGT